MHGKRAMLDKMPGDIWQKRATLRALYGYMYGHPGKKLMFMGCEFAQWREWNHDESLDWHLLEYPEHRGIQQWVRDLNRTLAEQPALHQVDFDHTGFEWLDCSDFEGSVVSFIRRAHDPSDFVVVAVNFTPVPRQDYVIGVPEPGRYVELLNSDAEIYGGSNLGNAGGARIRADPRARPSAPSVADASAAGMSDAEAGTLKGVRGEGRGVTLQRDRVTFRVTPAPLTPSLPRSVVLACITTATFTDLVAYSVAVPVLPDYATGSMPARRPSGCCSRRSA